MVLAKLPITIFSAWVADEIPSADGGGHCTWCSFLPLFSRPIPAPFAAQGHCVFLRIGHQGNQEFVVVTKPVAQNTGGLPILQ